MRIGPIWFGGLMKKFRTTLDGHRRSTASIASQEAQRALTVKRAQEAGKQFRADLARSLERAKKKRDE